MNILTFNLKDLSIRLKLLGLSIIFALGFLAFGLESFRTLQQVRVLGPLDIKITEQQEFIGELAPSSGNIEESYLTILQLQEGRTEEEVKTLEERLIRLRGAYQEIHEKWHLEMQDENILKNLSESEKVANDFFKIVDSQYLLLTRKSNNERVKAQALSALHKIYESYRKSIPPAVRAAQNLNKNLENETVRGVDHHQIELVVLGLVLLLIAGSTALLIANGISGPLESLSKAMDEFKENDLFQNAVEVKSKDEIGRLSMNFNRMTATVSQTRGKLLQSQKLESIGTLAGGIAHDFNNLLSGILAYTEILKKRHRSEEKTVRDLSIIEQSAERGAELTKQLLGFARKGNYEKSDFSLNDLVLEARKLLYRTVDKTITIKADLCPDAAAVTGDPGQILQILMNLGVNARDAMPDGGELWFETQMIDADQSFCKFHENLKPGTYIRLSVSDTGTGIPKEIQERIFDPFFTTKEVGKGTGLGLSMVHGIMENHGGSVGVYSEIGKGTRFNLYFPQGQAKQIVYAELADRPLDSERQEKRLQGVMILVVDDEALMRTIAKDVLEEEGATLFFANDGEEGIRFLQKNHSLLSVVLMDQIMPKMDGVKTFRELRRFAPDLPLIFTSGYAESKAISELRIDGAIDFIQKPYKSLDLIQSILKVIRSAAKAKPAA